MRAALICNGPSRTSFESRDDYDFVIGCNIPYDKADVDVTVIIDPEVIHFLAKNPELIKAPAYYSTEAWRTTDEIKKRRLFEWGFRRLVHTHGPYHSAGHVACEELIKDGYTDIDIYGCDSWFLVNVDSETHQYVNSTLPDFLNNCVTTWRERWNALIDNNPEVKINFIR